MQCFFWSCISIVFYVGYFFSIDSENPVISFDAYNLAVYEEIEEESENK